MNMNFLINSKVFKCEYHSEYFTHFIFFLFSEKLTAVEESKKFDVQFERVLSMNKLIVELDYKITCILVITGFKRSGIDS